MNRSRIAGTLEGSRPTRVFCCPAENLLKVALPCREGPDEQHGGGFRVLLPSRKGSGNQQDRQPTDGSRTVIFDNSDKPTAQVAIFRGVCRAGAPV